MRLFRFLNFVSQFPLDIGKYYPESNKERLSAKISTVKNELDDKTAIIRSEFIERIVEVENSEISAEQNVERLKKLGDLMLVGISYEKSENFVNILSTLCERIKFN